MRTRHPSSHEPPTVGIPCDGARLRAAHTRCLRVRPHSLSPASPTSSRLFVEGASARRSRRRPRWLLPPSTNGCQRAPPAHTAEHQTVANETHTKRAVATVGRSLALPPPPPPTSNTPPPPSIDPCPAPLPAWPGIRKRSNPSSMKRGRWPVPSRQRHPLRQACCARPRASATASAWGPRATRGPPADVPIAVGGGGMCRQRTLSTGRGEGGPPRTAGSVPTRASPVVNRGRSVAPHGRLAAEEQKG